jgi:hypothetical protein
MPIKPDKSVSRVVGPRDPRPFSSFDDLAAWLVALGRASTVQEVREQLRQVWGDLLFTWYTQGQVGCVFAQRLARSAGEARWYSAVVEGEWSAELLTGMVDAAAAARAEALQILFPCAGTAEDAIEIIRRMGTHPRWQCADAPWLDGEKGDSVQVGLRWIAPGGEYESWVLGIAPFEPMPFTRRLHGAPFIALVLRPTPPEPDRATAPVGLSGLPASHLAHMNDGLGPDQDRRKKWMHGTEKAKRALVSPDPMSRARAKVTFALPAWARRELAGVL